MAALRRHLSWPDPRTPNWLSFERERDSAEQIAEPRSIRRARSCSRAPAEMPAQAGAIAGALSDGAGVGNGDCDVIASASVRYRVER